MQPFAFVRMCVLKGVIAFISLSLTNYLKILI